MQRSSFVVAAVASAASSALLVRSVARADAASAVAADEPYDLATSSGTIFGSLRRPAGAAKTPVALIIAGSGPTDRDGNAPGVVTNMYAKLATALGAAGIATVRFDKRGIAASHAAMASESEIRFDAYVADAAAWIAQLRADDRFARVSVLGHSEGSLTGMVASTRQPVDALVSLEGAGFPIADVLRAQLKTRLETFPDLRAAADTILTSLAAGTTVPDARIPPPLLALFRPSIQPYLISWMRYDPRVEIRRATGRITIVQGTHDVQVTVDDGRALATARPDAAYVAIEGMTHVLVADPGTTIEQQQAVYTAGGSLPLDPTLVRTAIAAVRGA
jgi:pimeloyl-ACP methyl ester carboxylesterase